MLRDHSNHLLPGSARVAWVNSRTISGQSSACSGFTGNFTLIRIMLGSFPNGSTVNGSLPACPVRAASGSRTLRGQESVEIGRASCREGGAVTALTLGAERAGNGTHGHDE